LSKVVKKLSKSCQKVIKKLAKSWQKVSKLKICHHSPEKVTTAENSETVRGRRRRGRERRFVVPRPGATLSHLVKIVFFRLSPKACITTTFRESKQ
jgi:hypothetical protein